MPATTKPKIFISHFWADGRRYEELQEMLNRIFSGRWENASIPREHAVSAFNGSRPEMEHLSYLHRRLSSAMDNEIASLETKADEIKVQISKHDDKV